MYFFPLEVFKISHRSRHWIILHCLAPRKEDERGTKRQNTKKAVAQRQGIICSVSLWTEITHFNWGKENLSQIRSETFKKEGQGSTGWGFLSRHWNLCHGSCWGSSRANINHRGTWVQLILEMTQKLGFWFSVGFCLFPFSFFFLLWISTAVFITSHTSSMKQQLLSIHHPSINPQHTIQKKQCLGGNHLFKPL